MADTARFDTILPHALPDQNGARTLLFALRRMGVHGLRDAHAAHAMLSRYGLHYRRPLLLMRALLVEIAQAARGRVTLAPCCAVRMTADERSILAAIADPEAAPAALLPLLASPHCARPAEMAGALAETLAEIGDPIRL